MNENQKTLTFVVVGALALLIGFEPWRSQVTEKDVIEGKKLFPNFTNALSATSLEIIDFDEDNSTIKDFKIAQVDGVWRIPSHQNYPADAKEHLAAAATALSDIEILAMAGDTPGEREIFGVIDPDVKTLKAGSVGVGRRVIMKDAGDNTLADLIIGKEAKDTPAVRYVRKTDKDQIYRVAIKTDKLTTKFDDWIEKDLLKLNTFDIKEIAINDYSVKEGINAQGQATIGKIRTSEMMLAYDDAKSAWTLEESITYDDKKKPVEAKLKEGEELNTEKLNEMRTALDDLKIVDVERKPKGLNTDLTIAEEVGKNQLALSELANSLVSRGFYPVGQDEKSGKLTLASSEGEVIVNLKDGVAYVIRFGEYASGTTESADKKDGKPAEAGRNRYVMLTAQVDEAAIPKPDIKPLPEEEAKEEEKTEEADAKDAKSDKKADEKAEKKTGEKVNKKSDEKAADKKEEPAKDDKKTKADEAAAKKKLEEEKTAVTKENQRQQDEYDEKVKKADEKVKELNTRFADWYYVISDDVYKKIHLTRADIIKTKEKKTGEGDSVGDFKELDKDLGAPGVEAPAEPEEK